MSSQKLIDDVWATFHYVCMFAMSILSNLHIFSDEVNFFSSSNWWFIHRKDPLIDDIYATFNYVHIFVVSILHNFHIFSNEQHFCLRKYNKTNPGWKLKKIYTYRYDSWHTCVCRGVIIWMKTRQKLKNNRRNPVYFIT